MSRILLNYVLPLLIPMAVYLLWFWFSRRRGGGQGKSLAEEEPWFWVLSSGFLLMAGGLVYLALSESGETEGTYLAPHIEDGRIVPGTIGDKLETPGPESSK
ncbi:MAG: DUF6111 family protein [Rhodospirillales bacterium]